MKQMLIFFWYLFRKFFTSSLLRYLYVRNVQLQSNGDTERDDWIVRSEGVLRNRARLTPNKMKQMLIFFWYLLRKFFIPLVSLLYI